MIEDDPEYLKDYIDMGIGVGIMLRPWNYTVSIPSARTFEVAGPTEMVPGDQRARSLGNLPQRHRAAGSRSLISQGTWWLRTKISGGPDGSTHSRPISAAAGHGAGFPISMPVMAPKSSRLEKKLVHSDQEVRGGRREI